MGWFRGSANETDKAYLRSYLKTDGSDIAWDFIRACMAAVPRTCVIMMQVCKGGGLVHRGWRMAGCPQGRYRCLQVCRRRMAFWPEPCPA